MNLQFLRPLALPRPATFRAFFSTTSSTRALPLVSSTALKADFIPATEAAKAGSLPYHVSRTPSKNLPIYLLKKRGGNLHQTKVQKITGDVARLRQELQDHLQMESNEVVINSLTRHIIIRGHRKSQVVKFLEARNF